MAEAAAKGHVLRLSLQLQAYLARDEADAREKLAITYDYYKRFDNVFGGPGIVSNGMIDTIPRKQSMDEMAENLLICPPNEMSDKLGRYADAGIDEVIFSTGFGQQTNEIMELMQNFASDTN